MAYEALTSENARYWDKQGEPRALPAEIVERTAARYRELIDRLCAE